MKTTTVNAYMIISMVIALLAFYAGALPSTTDPKLIMWLAGGGSALSIILKQFFPSGTWTGTGASASFYILNGLVVVAAILPSWGELGIISASVASIIVGGLNVLLSYFGYVPNFKKA